LVDLILIGSRGDASRWHYFFAGFLPALMLLCTFTIDLRYFFLAGAFLPALMLVCTFTVNLLWLYVSGCPRFHCTGLPPA
jgi:hypothetical protein